MGEAKAAYVARANRAARPFGVYVHFPYCEQKCPYCDFASRLEQKIPHRAYAERVLDELLARAALFDGQGRELVSVYFGGGTPGLWAPDELGRVLAAIAERFGAAGALARGELEVTVESNPGSTKPAQLAGLRAVGVNRLSIGVQSLDDADLRALGRIHDAETARRAVREARAAGFASESFDLIFAVPGQDLLRLDAVLAGALALEPRHLSVYNLTVEPGTVYGARARRGERLLPDDDVQADMFDLVERRLVDAGLVHYEISNYARPGHEAIHNTLYWRGDEYLGLGVSAHSHLVLDDGRAVRYGSARDIDAYLAGRSTACLDALALLGDAEVAVHEVLTVEERARETMFLGLRLLEEGVGVEPFARRFGDDPRRRFAATCEGLLADGLLLDEGTRLRLSPAGARLADSVAGRFV